MTRTETIDVWLCTDCGMLTANGTDGWGLAADGTELGELHAARMRAYGPDAELVVSGCPEGEPCEFAPPTICGACDPDDLATADPDECDHGDPGNTHECRFDREFSSVQCDGCGTQDAGFRFAAVEFVRSLSASSEWLGDPSNYK